MPRTYQARSPALIAQMFRKTTACPPAFRKVHAKRRTVALGTPMVSASDVARQQLRDALAILQVLEALFFRKVQHLRFIP